MTSASAKSNAGLSTYVGACTKLQLTWYAAISAKMRSVAFETPSALNHSNFL